LPSAVARRHEVSSFVLAQYSRWDPDHFCSFLWYVFAPGFFACRPGLSDVCAYYCLFFVHSCVSGLTQGGIVSLCLVSVFCFAWVVRGDATIFLIVFSCASEPVHDRCGFLVGRAGCSQWICIWLRIARLASMAMSCF